MRTTDFCEWNDHGRGFEKGEIVRTRGGKMSVRRIIRNRIVGSVGGLYKTLEKEKKKRKKEGRNRNC